MRNKLSKKSLVIITCVAVISIAAICTAALTAQYNSSNPSIASSQESQTNVPEHTDEIPVAPIEAYKGVSTSVADKFSIKVPNGWRASIANNPEFLAIMFARPNQLDSLVYNEATPPIVDNNGIPSWGGLTEHFFVILPTAARAFNPQDHLEVSSKPFTFDDGTVGQSYYVVKHADEANKWGGLQKDTEWQGRTYIYEKDGKKVEAHLALYPSTSVSIPFYESVVRTLTF